MPDVLLMVGLFICSALGGFLGYEIEERTGWMQDFQLRRRLRRWHAERTADRIVQMGLGKFG